MNKQKIKYILIGFGIFFIIMGGAILTFQFHNRQNNENLSENDNQSQYIGNSDVSDNEDLINSDYTKYYDQLKDYGKWIRVDLKDYGINEKSVNDIGKKDLSFYIRNFLGINDATAHSNLSWGVFFVWQPSPNFAVSISEGEPVPSVFVPYTYGRWIYTNDGWYFRSASYESEIVHHYGRWVFVPGEGWIWIPGHRWAPAWVEWAYDEDDDYVAWVPKPPCMYFENRFVTVPRTIVYDNFIVVNEKHFLEPKIHRFLSNDFKDRVIKFENRNTAAGRFEHNNTVYKGPEADKFERKLNTKINPVNTENIRRYSDSRKDFKNFDIDNINYKKENKNNIKDKLKSESNSDINKKGFKNKNDFKSDRQQKRLNSGVIKEKNKSFNKEKSNGKYGLKNKNESAIKKDRTKNNDRKFERKNDVRKNKSNENSNNYYKQDKSKQTKESNRNYKNDNQERQNKEYKFGNQKKEKMNNKH
jgi:hypothetical protein